MIGTFAFFQKLLLFKLLNKISFLTPFPCIAEADGAFQRDNSFLLVSLLRIRALSKSKSLEEKS